MVDKEMLEAMSAMMDEKLDKLEKTIDTKFEAQHKKAVHAMKVLIETEVTTKFNLLSDQLKTITVKLPDTEITSELDDRVCVLEGIARNHSRDIAELKKAN